MPETTPRAGAKSATSLSDRAMAARRASAVRAREAQAARRAAGIEPERMPPLERAQANPRSRDLAIRAMCWDCTGRGQDPGWQRAVGECEVRTCPLNHLRPYQKQNAPDLDDETAEGIAPSTDVIDLIQYDQAVAEDVDLADVGSS